MMYTHETGWIGTIGKEQKYALSKRVEFVELQPVVTVGVYGFRVRRASDSFSKKC